MNRTDKLVEIAAQCRVDHGAALAIVGWFCAAAPESELDALLKLIEGLRQTSTGRSHYEAYRERWGRVPG